MACCAGWCAGKFIKGYGSMRNNCFFDIASLLCVLIIDALRKQHYTCCDKQKEERTSFMVAEWFHNKKTSCNKKAAFKDSLNIDTKYLIKIQLLFACI